MVAWLKDNQKLAIVLALCVTGLIALAMVLGLDLSWIPALIDKLTG